MTYEEFKTLPAGEVFRVVVQVSPALTGEAKETMFVCKKGTGLQDWAIYAAPTQEITHRFDEIYSVMVDAVKSWGTKITMKEWIKTVIDCDDEMLKAYRH